MKLYGKELDKELDRRKKIKEERINKKLTLTRAAKENNMGLTPSEYFDWERGSDICPHEEWEKSIGGVHPPFLLIEFCKKCHLPRIISKIETEEDCDKYEEELEEALKNAGMLGKKEE